MTHYDIDVAVIGGGSAGLTAAVGCAWFGARTVLIERDRLGGDCTWRGCVPSKALLHAASMAAKARRMTRFGIHAGEVSVDFEKVMRRLRRVRREIYEHTESPERLRGLGVIPMQAEARFVDEHTLHVENERGSGRVHFRSAIIATGASPFVPTIDGLDDVDYLTNENVFELTQQPAHLAILGCGAIGVELGQAFARLGTNLTLITRDDQILAGEEPSLVSMLESRLCDDGIDLRFNSTIHRVARDDRGLRLLVGHDEAAGEWIDASDVLVATGRAPNVEGLQLGRAGVEYSHSGIEVDRACRTSQPHIFAVGDVTTAPKLTHMGEEMAKRAAINAVGRLPFTHYEQDVIPQAIYTDPELARVGATAAELHAAGRRFGTIEFPYSRIDRAIIEDEADGSIIVHHDRVGRILGVSVLGTRAGEMIDEFALAMSNSIRLDQLAQTLHAYPTMLLGARRAADQFPLRQIKPWMVRAFQLAYGYRGRIPAGVGKDEIL